MDLKSINWQSYQKYFSPNMANDLNVFLEKLPSNVSQTMLVIAGIVWAVAGTAGLYVTIQLQQLTELRIELQEAEALRPIVPQIRDVAVNAQEVSQFIERTKGTYTGLEVKNSGSSIFVGAKNVGQFGQWREAIGHVQNGGSGWRVNIERLCIGRECQSQPLAASLRINKVSVENPAG